MCCDADINTPWAKRLYDFLREYPYDYVVFLLDVFILSDFVDDYELNRVHSIMKQHPEIACFNFMETYKDAEDSVREDYERYYLKDRKAEFRMNLQAAIWRKDYLMKFIRKHENPWQFETWGKTTILNHSTPPDTKCHKSAQLHIKYFQYLCGFSKSQ